MRVYPMDPQRLTAEQLAVVFAMTSRRPEAFDEIAEVVTTEKAKDFHERWVLNYGHASVAEHAVLHMAVEDISRLACDTLEDNRLGSYTEKSSRYQIISSDSYHVPGELTKDPLREYFINTCTRLFGIYETLLEKTQSYLKGRHPKLANEKESSFNLRIRREAIDSCRFILPAATLTNVGVTMNARSMEHAIRKLLSSELAEEQELGEKLKTQGRRITPTLIKYATRNEYMVETRKVQKNQGSFMLSEAANTQHRYQVRLVHVDPQAEAKVAAAFMYRDSKLPYASVWEKVTLMPPKTRKQILNHALSRLGDHDTPIRELEQIYYSFELVMDYGAYREFKRHRMQSCVTQPITVDLGYLVPPLVQQAGLEDMFQDAMSISEDGYHRLASRTHNKAPVEEYLVTHAHYQRLFATMNLRECYHLFKLRTQPTAHFSIVGVMLQAMELAQKAHPALFKHLSLRT